MLHFLLSVVAEINAEKLTSNKKVDFFDKHRIGRAKKKHEQKILIINQKKKIFDKFIF